MRPRRSACLAVLFALAMVLSCTSGASAEEAAPLPSKDIRWSALVGGALDAGSLSHAAPGVALGFDVRRGALGARAVASAFLGQRDDASDHGSGASVALYDAMAMVCALAPFASRFDGGACGGGGVGLLHAVSGGPEPTRSGIGFRPQGLALARLDMTLVPGLVLSLDAGTVIDPLRSQVPLEGLEGGARSSLFAFRGSLSMMIRLW